MTFKVVIQPAMVTAVARAVADRVARAAGQLGCASSVELTETTDAEYESTRKLVVTHELPPAPVPALRPDERVVAAVVGNPVAPVAGTTVEQVIERTRESFKTDVQDYLHLAARSCIKTEEAAQIVPVVADV